MGRSTVHSAADSLASLPLGLAPSHALLMTSSASSINNSNHHHTDNNNQQQHNQLSINIAHDNTAPRHVNPILNQLHASTHSYATSMQSTPPHLLYGTTLQKQLSGNYPLFYPNPSPLTPYNTDFTRQRSDGTNSSLFNTYHSNNTINQPINCIQNDHNNYDNNTVTQATGSSDSSAHASGTRHKTACAPCYIAKTSCSGERPCTRCSRLNRNTDCVDRPKYIKRQRAPKPVDGVPAKRGRKPKPRDANGNIIHINDTNPLTTQLMNSKLNVYNYSNGTYTSAITNKTDNNTTTNNHVQINSVSLQPATQPISILPVTSSTPVNESMNDTDDDNSAYNSADEHNNSSHSSQQNSSAHSYSDELDPLIEFDAEDLQLSRAFLAIIQKSWPGVEQALMKQRLSLATFELLTAFQSNSLLPADQLIYAQTLLSSPTITKALQRIGSDNWMSRTKFNFIYSQSPNEATPDDPKLPNVASYSIETLSVTKHEIKHESDIDPNSLSDDLKQSSDSSTAANDDSYFRHEVEVQSRIVVNREFERVFGWSQSEVKAMFSRSGILTVYKHLIPIKTQVARNHIGTKLYNKLVSTDDMIDDNTYRIELERIISQHFKAILGSVAQFTSDVIIHTKWNQRLPCLYTTRFVQTNTNSFSCVSSSFLPIPTRLLDQCVEAGNSDKNHNTE